MFKRFRAEDVRSILAAGTAARQSHPSRFHRSETWPVG